MVTVSAAAVPYKPAMKSAAASTMNPDQSKVPLGGMLNAAYIRVPAASVPMDNVTVAAVPVVLQTWMFRTMAVVEAGAV